MQKILTILKKKKKKRKKKRNRYQKKRLMIHQKCNVMYTQCLFGVPVSIMLTQFVGVQDLGRQHMHRQYQMKFIILNC
ncbi:hypothetical protein ASE55_16425 [Chryseobacterium sp. Leaf201]|nr:hypothetical protein ASE55_16425 [Chryseobacterium sp. Leaf201]